MNQGSNEPESDLGIAHDSMGDLFGVLTKDGNFVGLNNHDPFLGATNVLAGVRRPRCARWTYRRPWEA